MRLLISKASFFILLFMVLPVSSWCDEFDNDFEEKPWEEIEVQLPAFPEQENLISFQVGANLGKRYFIDGRTVSVGADGVIRFVLVIISQAGAKNISFEGMRCATNERRTYAFGRSDNTWSKSRSNQWVRIMGDSNNHFVDLFKNYFCTVGERDLMSSEDAQRVLRSGGAKPSNDSGF